LKRHYLDALPGEENIEKQFGFPGENGFAGALARVAEKGSWTGRIVPHNNLHGISSVEVTLQAEDSQPGVLYLYTLEHPSVDGTLRFSSRSEMQLLQVLMENTLEYVFFRDNEGRLILTNRAFREAVDSGETNRTVTGRTIGDFVSEKSAEWVREIDERVRSSGRPSVNRVSLFTFRNGTKHWLQMTTVPVRDAENVIIGSVSVARDISDLKQTESELRGAIKQAEDASRAKGEFLAAMSHEIRTPINGIVGAAELCQETRLDPEQRGYIETVMQCSNTLLALVNDVLDFSKIEAGQLNLEKLSFDPGQLIEEVSEEFAQVAHKKGLELIVAYEDLPRYLFGDPTRIKQILYNLVSNAIKFTETGEVVIRADVLERDESTATMRFAVKDTGIGISEQRKDAIFLSFTQEDMTTTRKYGGTGLGLTICRELANLMKGEVSVNSQIGKGSIFALEVPLELAANAGADAVPFNPKLAGLHVLVVDDNETNRDIYQKVCAGWGYRSGVASEGMEALKMLQDAEERGDPFQLVILDQQMPGLSGLDIASLIFSRRPIENTKVILLSSSLNRSEIERAESIGISRALSKPVKRSTLLEVVLETFDVRAGDDQDTPSTGETRTGDRSDSTETSEPLQVLLAEDNPVNQKIAIRRLEKFGHQVTVVGNGLLAADALRERRFDCVLMDIQMPEMDGYEATRKIRAMERERSLDPAFIVAMTAHAMKGDAEKCLSTGMDDYLPKPFKVERLKEVLQRASVRRSKHQSSKADERTEAEPLPPFEERFLRMNDEEREDVAESAPVLSESLPGDLFTLEEGLLRDDFEKIAFSAHTLKGVAGIFGYTDIVEVAERLESAAKDEQRDKCSAYGQDFIVKMKAMREEIEKVLELYGPEARPS